MDVTPARSMTHDTYSFLVFAVSEVNRLEPGSSRTGACTFVGSRTMELRDGLLVSLALQPSNRIGRPTAVGIVGASEPLASLYRAGDPIPAVTELLESFSVPLFPFSTLASACPKEAP